MAQMTMLSYTCAVAQIKYIWFPWGVGRFTQIGTSQPSFPLTGLSEGERNVPFEESDTGCSTLIGFFSLRSMIHWP